jgi:hypothetical protein
MKKTIVCCLLLCCCALLKAQTKQDSLPQKFKQPMFMPNVGFSTLLGGYAKVGTWIKLTNRFYGEVGYAYYHFKDDNVPNEYIERTNKNKFLAGINFVNKKQTFFQGASVRYGIFKLYSKVSHRDGTFEEKDETIYDIFYYSYNIGFMKSFKLNENSLGILTKYGIIWPYNIFASGYLFPINFELSIYYTIH